jgi:RNA polymerase sigma-70 factor (ECF subfamily)
MKQDIACEFEKIYGSESDSIFRFCLVRVSNREQALDITQETFLRLWQNMLKEIEIKNNKAFLFTVAHRLIIDWYRKKKSISLESIMHREGEIDYEPVDEKSVDNLDLRAEGRYLLDKINELAPGSRHPVYLRFVEGLSPGEIGEILGISANAASVRVNRGLLELRKKTGYHNNEN